jgi:hypothetical protein
VILVCVLPADGNFATEATQLVARLEAEAKQRQATSGPGIYGGKPLEGFFLKRLTTTPLRKKQRRQMRIK